MAYVLTSTDTFDSWFKALKNKPTKNRVLARLARIEAGNFGDFKDLKQGLYELRFAFGSGLRIYYTTQNQTVVLLVSGGDKSSQQKDIIKARKLIEPEN
jgi:putative addiction module killer protein